MPLLGFMLVLNCVNCVLGALLYADFSRVLFCGACLAVYCCCELFYLLLFFRVLILILILILIPCPVK